MLDFKSGRGLRVGGVQAVVVSELGPPSVLVAADVPDPVAGPGQALVEVEVVSVTFVETQVRSGRPPHPAMAPRLPAILGNSVGGVVVAVGDGADRELVGTRVVTTTGGTGGYAQRAAVAAAGLIPVPDGLEPADAVALLADGRTAMGLMRSATPHSRRDGADRAGRRRRRDPARAAGARGRRARGRRCARSPSCAAPAPHPRSHPPSPAPRSTRRPRGGCAR
jgi:hypothetical protein